MKNHWSVWLFVVIVLGIVIVAFNRQDDSVPLEDIFPGENVQYEYINKNSDPIEGDTAALKDDEITPVDVGVVGSSEPSEVFDAPDGEANSQEAPAVKDAEISGPVYAIQIAASKNKERLEADLSKVKAKGYPGYIITKTSGDSTWHRIYIGKFSTKDEANEYLNKVRDDYSDAFVILYK